MEPPAVKITRTGTQRFEATFKIDLESKQQSKGQEVVIPSLCGTRGAVWKLYWFIQTDGRLWAGIGWTGSAAGAVTGWSTCKLEIGCSALSNSPLGGFTWTSAVESLPPDETSDFGMRLQNCQGKGHGTQEITVSFEISFDSPPTSFAPGYTGEYPRDTYSNEAC